MYKYVVRDEGSSVYTALSKALKSESDWKRVHKDNPKANLVLLERNNQRFWKLAKKEPRSYKPKPPIMNSRNHLLQDIPTTSTHVIVEGKSQQPGLKQLVNYYRGSSVICRKVRLLSLLKDVFASRGQDTFQWMPESFIVRPLENLKSHASSNNNKKPMALENMTDEREAFVEAHERHKCSGSGDVWIAKSSSGAKGEGIIISRSPDELVSLVDSQIEGHVVQKYIERPLLLTGQRKFDIRCWVLLDHEYKIHLMKEGVLRTSSECYDADNLDNVTSHLTNHCIQEEHSVNFGKFEDGNEMFFEEFNRFLEEKYKTTLADNILPQIKGIVKECLLIIKEDITTEDLSYHSFQLFGFDFMIDADFKVWLIEVNGAPACAQKLLPQLTSSLLELVIRPLFPRQTPHYLSDAGTLDDDDDHGFEII